MWRNEASHCPDNIFKNQIPMEKSDKNGQRRIRGERKNREEREVVAIETEKREMLTM